LASLVQATPEDLKPSPGQLTLDPLQLSAVSQSPAAARHTVELPSRLSDGQVVLVPEHVSAASHTPAAARHDAPALPAWCWQAVFVPSHWSTVQGLLSLVQAVAFGRLASAGQLPPVPEHVSCASHSPEAARHTTVFAENPSAGQVVAVPVHFSSTSHTPTAARQVVPELPAGCRQLTLEPSHWSRVHGLLSAVQLVPLAFLASAGQAVVVPLQLSAASQSPAEARHTTLAGAALHVPSDPTTLQAWQSL
jgi:hypothetical protein